MEINNSIRTFISLGIAISLLLIVSACAEVPLESEATDSEAKQFNIPKDKGRIYVYRNQTFGGALKVSLALDRQLKGQTAPRTYYAWDVEPGRHTVSCLGSETKSVEVFVTEGMATFIRQEMAAGWLGAHCTVEEAPEEEGRSGVSECKLGKRINQ